MGSLYGLKLLWYHKNIFALNKQKIKKLDNFAEQAPQVMCTLGGLTNFLILDAWLHESNVWKQQLSKCFCTSQLNSCFYVISKNNFLTNMIKLSQQINNLYIQYLYP